MEQKPPLNIPHLIEKLQNICNISVSLMWISASFYVLMFKVAGPATLLKGDSDTGAFLWIL